MGSRNEDGGMGRKRKRGCGWKKVDFLPEESFQNWGTYLNALGNTKERLKDRLLTRSLDEVELHALRHRSENEMKKTLNWWDLLWFGIGAVMGSGIFVLTGQAASQNAGPAVIISYFISGVSAILSVLCYTEFAVELPVAGGSFSYLRVELGDFVAYIAAGNILFEYIVAGAGVARSWTSYFATLCNHRPNDFRFYVSSFAQNYNRLDPIAVVASILICVLACLSTKGSSRFNWISTIIHMVIIAFMLVAGLTKAHSANLKDFTPFGFRGILKASSMLFFAYVGFDGATTLAEEIKKPSRDIPVGLVGSMSVVMTVYCLLAGMLVLMQPYSQIDVDAPYSVAFTAVGMDWAKYIVAFGALKGMTTVLLANIIGQARYFTHIGRTHMAPPFLASINRKTGTPVNATIVMTIANSVVAFFTGLDVLANLLSISTLFIFSLVALALLVRRYYVSGETSESDRNKFIGFLVVMLGSSIGMSVYWGVSEDGWIGYVVGGGVWFLATLGLHVGLEQGRKPKIWGAPLVPWLPSASIAINVFILGSMDGASFARFAVWTGMLLVYYLFVGLHASFDAAKEAEKEAQVSQPTAIEAGVTAP